MNKEQKQKRYERIINQLEKLFLATEDPVSRMATAASLLYHKMGHFFWVGFYRMIDGELLVGPYQGAIACQRLEKDTGVCWACFNSGESIIVGDVEKFPGHIACDSRSRSEIVIPVYDAEGRKMVAVFDGDSDLLDTYDEVDEANLRVLAGMIYGD